MHLDQEQSGGCEEEDHVRRQSLGQSSSFYHRCMLSGTSSRTHRRVPLGIRLSQPLEERRLLRGRKSSTAIRLFLRADTRLMPAPFHCLVCMSHAVRGADPT